jgi:acyl-CoA thioesterase FadM
LIFPEPDVRARIYTRMHKVLSCEVGATGHTHPHTLFDWIGDSVFEASEQAGWPVERWLAAGFMTYQSRHDAMLLALPSLGARIRLTSQIVELRRLRGTWLVEINEEPDGRLLARDYSTGVFLDLQGQPSAPPKEMMDAIRYGS